MNNYEKVALIAAETVKNGGEPKKAWELASCQVFQPGSAAQKRAARKMLFYA